MANKTKSDGKSKKRRSPPFTVKEEVILELVGMQGVITASQVAEWFGVKTRFGIRNRMTDMCRRDNPLLTNRNLPRPWRNFRAESAAFLTDIGAAVLNERNGTSIIAPNPMTQRKNLIHALGLVDIAIALKKAGILFELERRININDDGDEFIRPDVFCHVNGVRHLIEFEQSRGEEELSARLLGRLRRWQKVFTSPGFEDVSSDVIVLFDLDKDDRYTLVKWSAALNSLAEELGCLPAYSVWAMNVITFLNNPTLDLHYFTRVRASNNPDADALAAERERFIAYQLNHRMTLEGMLAARNAVESIFDEYRGRLLEMQYSTVERQQFLNDCDTFYQQAHSGRPSEFQNSGIPWLGIAMLRCWIEQPVFADFRLILIDALEKLKSSYTRGLNSAADTLERLVWDVLLRRFEIAKGGPLKFYAAIGTPEKDNYRSSGLVPVFSIQSPWHGVREDQEKAETTVQALTWLVRMLMDYPVELGLTKANKKAQSAALLEPVKSMPEDEEFDPPPPDDAP